MLKIRMFLLDRFYCDIFFFQNHFNNSKSFEYSYRRVQMIDILLKYILWYDFLNNLDAQSDFEKSDVTKMPVK